MTSWNGWIWSKVTTRSKISMRWRRKVYKRWKYEQQYEELQLKGHEEERMRKAAEKRAAVEAHEMRGKGSRIGAVVLRLRASML